MALAVNLRLNKDALTKAKHNKKHDFDIKDISGDGHAYKIGLANDKGNIFEINLHKSSETTDMYDFNTISRTDRAKSTDEILRILYLHKSFYEKTIKINGEKLFGDILIGEAKDFSYENVDDTIEYWLRIKKLEQALSTKFQIQLPLTDDEAELMEELCISFVDNMPVALGHMNYIDIVPKDLSQLQDIKGMRGDFAVVMKCDGLNLQGVDLSDLYYVLFYSDIKVNNYKKIPNSEVQSQSFRLDIDESSDSFVAVKYFRNKETANKYLQERSQEFKKARKLWS